MNLLQLLLGSVASNDSVNSVSKKTGVSSKMTSKLLMLAIPILLKQLTKNASNKEGAQSLLGALSQHTSKESVSHQLANADAEDGAKIIGHILGKNQNSVVNDLAKQSGASKEEVNSILNNIAPALLNSLGTATNSVSNKKVDLSDGLDLSDVLNLVSGVKKNDAVSNLANNLLGGNNSNEKLLANLLGNSSKKEESALSSLLGNNTSNGSDLLGFLLNNLNR